MNKTSFKLTTLLLAALLATTALASCGGGDDKNGDASDTTDAQTVFVAERDDSEVVGDEYVVQKKYYKAIHYGDTYTCQVIDRGGNIAIELELPAEPKVEIKNGNKVIKLTYGDTDSASTTVNYYYDHANDRSSAELKYVLDEFYATDDNSLVTIFEDGVLYVRGIFYINGELYKMALPLTKNVADTDAPIISAKFEDSTTVTVEYVTSDGKNFTETVSLIDTEK